MTVEHGRLSSPADIGDLVRSIRIRNAVSQDELAAMVGVTQRWLSEVERGLPKILDDRYLEVLRKLGIRLTYEVRNE